MEGERYFEKFCERDIENFFLNILEVFNILVFLWLIDFLWFIFFMVFSYKVIKGKSFGLFWSNCYYY